jgi:hypothetical protein
VYEDDGVRRKEDANKHAIEQCALYKIPSPVVRIIAEGFNRHPADAIYIGVLSSCLPSFFAGGFIQPDPPTLAALDCAAAFVVENMKSIRLRYVINAIFYLTCLDDACNVGGGGGLMMTGQLASHGLLELFLQRLQEEKLEMSCLYQRYCVLCRLCAYGSASAGPGEKNILLDGFRKENGMEFLLEMEHELQGKILEVEEGSVKKRLFQKTRDKTICCLCHLLKKCARLFICVSVCV